MTTHVAVGDRDQATRGPEGRGYELAVPTTREVGAAVEERGGTAAGGVHEPDAARPASGVDPLAQAGERGGHGAQEAEADQAPGGRGALAGPEAVQERARHPPMHVRH